MKVSKSIAFHLYRFTARNAKKHFEKVKKDAGEGEPPKKRQRPTKTDNAKEALEPATKSAAKPKGPEGKNRSKK